MIYSAIRTYRVQEVVYVEAESHAEARRKARDGDWFDNTDPQAISADRWERTYKRPDLAMDDDGRVANLHAH